MLQNKKTETLKIQGFRSLFRADDGNRTRDLRTTNATHYRLCYISFVPNRDCSQSSFGRIP